jgi:transcriptional regulator with XRE-family HTH domain
MSIEQILARLTHARKQAGLSQAQAGKLLDLGASTISHYESGARELSVAMLLRLAKLYEVDVSWLMTGVNPNFTDAQRQAVVDAYQKVVNKSVDDLHSTLELLESLSQEP